MPSIGRLKEDAGAARVKIMGGDWMRLSVGTKIGGGFLVVLFLLVIIVAEAVNVISTTKEQIISTENRFQRVSLDYQIKESFQGVALAIRGYMVYGDEKYLNQYSSQVKKVESLLTKRLSNCAPETKPLIEKALDRVKEYDRQLTQNVVPMLKEGKRDQAIAAAVIIVPITEELNKTFEDRISDNELKSSKVIDETLTAATKGRIVVIVVGLLALFIGAILAIFITRSITNPVNVMMSGVKKLANGDLTQNVSVKAKDEIGELALAINQTREQLKELISGIVIAAQSLAAHSEELAASVEEISATIEEVASTTNEVAATAEKSLEDANATADESKKVVEVADMGGKTVSLTIEKINSISDSSTKVHESIQNLGEFSNRIGNITDVITGIADQTNLLALNAAIEAARAGDQGRGFAVVAEEVRKLAEQSASAAKEIGQLITQIQSGVDTAVRSMEQGAVEVKEGVDLASEAGKSLNNIITAIKRNIKFVEEINLGAKQTSDGTQHLSTSNEQVTSTVQQIASATQELADIANKLQVSVAQFKV